MAQIRRHRRAIAALLGLAALTFAPALSQAQGSKDGTDLYDRPLLAIDTGMHTAGIEAQAVDAGGRFAVTGSDDRTVRIWSLADGKLLRTIWIPSGPEKVGDVFAVAIGADGSTIAVGGWTERLEAGSVIYLFDRESGNLVRRIHDDLTDVTSFLTFSPNGRYLAAMLGGSKGLRVFDRDKNWAEAFRDEQYGSGGFGASFTRDGRLATTSFDGLIRLYIYDPNMQVQTKGEFGGLGLRVTQEDGFIKVVSLIEDTPAAKAGVLSGDVITAIDDTSTQGLTRDQAVDKMRGAINSAVSSRSSVARRKRPKSLLSFVT
jgi:PDZ domain/WD domain, G-beta repeat